MVELKQLGSNYHMVTLGLLVVYFSYEIPVAMYHPDVGRVVSENIWSNMTGKHLNEIDPSESGRVSHSTVLENIKSFFPAV